MKTWSLVLLGLAASLAMGCENDGGGTTAVGPVPEEQAPETVPATVCTQYASCGCDPAEVAPDCDSHFEDQMRQALGDATAAGLEYDAACMGQVLTAYRELDCRRLSDLSLEDLVDLSQRYQCKVFYGTGTPGQECTELPNLGDSCVGSSRCDDGLCVALPEIAAEGEECESALETIFTACEPGTYCVDLDGDEVARCLRPPAQGETCIGSQQLCDEDLSCVEGTCLAAPSVGEPCHQGPGAPCADQAVCDVETVTCIAAPSGGEDCVFSCARGFTCEDGRCVDELPLVCDTELYDADEGN